MSHIVSVVCVKYYSFSKDPYWLRFYQENLVAERLSYVCRILKLIARRKQL